MKRTLHFVNGMTAMVLGLIVLSVGVTTSFSLAAPLTQKKVTVPLQPKIISIKTEAAAPSFGTAGDAMLWPADAGIINEVSSDTTGVWVTPSVQAGYKISLKWAHVAKWSDEAPNPGDLMGTIIAAAKSDITAESFSTNARSQIFPVDSATQTGKYVTIYSYATNGDEFSPSFFPLHIDYGTASTFFVPIADPITDSADLVPSSSDEAVY